ncbi:hypothetical protein [Sinosporangium siamense]|nr:hypothetical protein [Sinosporangium siamense]
MYGHGEGGGIAAGAAGAAGLISERVDKKVVAVTDGGTNVGTWGAELPFTGFPVMFSMALSVALILGGLLIIRSVRLRRAS